MSGDQVWVLDLLKSLRASSSAPTTLAFFHTTLLPLARKCDAYANSDTVTALEANTARQRVLDVWAIFPAFCTTATDVAASFPAVAVIAMKAMSDVRYPGLILPVSAGLRAIVDSAIEADEGKGDRDALKGLEGKVMPALFNLVDTLSSSGDASAAASASADTDSSSNISPAQKLSAVTAAIATYSKVCSPPFLASLFKKIMQKLLLATQSSPSKENDAKLMNLLDLSHSIVPTLDAASVGLMVRAVKPMIRSDAHDALVQKRGYKVLLSLFEHHASAVTAGEGLASTVEFLASAMMTAHVSARNMRLQCLTFLVESLDGSDRTQTDVIPTVIGEVMLCLKDSNKKTRESGYTCLLAMCAKRGDMADFYQIILGGYAAQTPHMRSAAVMALSRVVFEHAKSDATTSEMLPGLLKTTLLLFREKAREVIKSAVGFVRICVAAMTPEELEPLVGDIVVALMQWNHGKDRFRAKIKIILKKLVIRYGFENIREHVPKEDERLMTHIRKIAERQQRKKEKNGGQSVRGSVCEGDFEDMLDSDEEDSDGAKTLMTGMTGFTEMTAKSGKTTRSAAMDKSERASAKSKAESAASARTGKSGAGGAGGKGVLVREGDDYDMLDASMAKNLKYQNNYDNGYNSQDDDGSDEDVMEFDDKGRLIVGDGMEGEGFGGGGGDNDDDDDDDDDDEDLHQKLDKKMSQFMADGNNQASQNRPMKYEKAQEKMKEGDKKRRKTDAKNAPGAAFKSKKAGGDVRRKGDKFEPFAYIPLNGKEYTKKHKGKAVESMSHVVRKQGKGNREGEKGRGNGRENGGKRKR